MGWDLSKKKEYEKWKKENKKRAEKLADMDLWNVQTPTGEWMYSAADIERINRVGARLANKGGAGGISVPTPPSWLNAPSYNPWPASPGQYARWGSGQTQAQPPWYAPQAQLEGQPWAAIVNRLLPYMGEDDQSTVARQLYTAGGGQGGPFKGYLGTGQWGQSGTHAVPPPPPQPDTYESTLGSIGAILQQIPDALARDWASSIFDIYRDWTKSQGMRGTEEEQVFQAQLEELMSNPPESAAPYIGAMQRLVQPTVRDPEREWYEMTGPQRTSPTNWRVLGYRANPMWM